MGSTYLISFLYCSYLILDHIDMLNNDVEAGGLTRFFWRCGCIALLIPLQSYIHFISLFNLYYSTPYRIVHYIKLAFFG
jgi:hypothetical protein